MQLLDRFEQRIDQLVNGAFARAFKAEVQPVEIAAALQRELDDHAVALGSDQDVVPNVYTVDLSSRDFERLMAFEAPLCTELANVVTEYAEQQRCRLIGSALVRFTEDPALGTGVFRVRTEARADREVEEQRRGPHLTVNGFIHPLTRHTTRLGRGTDVDIRIDDAGVSRHHAEIVLSMPVLLRDLGSTNGTWVGGERITEMELTDDTEITIGPAVIEFHVR